MEIFKGYVEHVVYRNEENGYTVLYLSASGEEDTVTAVGILPEVGDGECLELTGKWTVHATYGEQFKFDSFRILPPEDERAMERYLGSGLIKGIGKKLAQRIVARFGADTFTILDHEPERLAEIKGISKAKAREISEQVCEKRDMRDGLLFLGQYGVPNNMAMRIWQQYGPDIYQIVRENPYRLAEEISGIGFRTADEIARKAGVAVDSRFRICGALLYALELAGAEGSLYLPKDVLLKRTRSLLGLYTAPGYEADLYGDPELLDPELFADAPEEWGTSAPSPASLPEALEDAADPVGAGLLDLSAERKVILKEEEGISKVYPAPAYYAELRCARLLLDLNGETGISEEEARTRAVSAAMRGGTQLDERQLDAVIRAQSHTLLILTGGPGTGKTTTINTMISVFEDMGLDIELAAPTGRAAKRMTEATGRDARTIHRLLEVRGDPESEYHFGRGEEQPLEADVIIVDEMSMVDMYLFRSLLSAVVPGTRLIMVGDANQLPSVGPGSVLRDMIESGVLPVITLTTIFRQAQLSDIVLNAHRIHAGEHLQCTNKSRDFFFIRESDPGTIIGTAIKLVRDSLPPYVHAPSADIQVMAPMKKGTLGVARLNQVMQRYLNPPEEGAEEYRRGETVFRENDRVMQIRNNYQIAWTVRGRGGTMIDSGEGVFNGDMGIVRRINRFAGIMTVEFDEHRFVEYELSELDQLELAYAVTIHKAQGSEYPAVVIPLLSGPHMLMTRNLLYTAVTRATTCVVLVGDPAAMNRMIDNVTEAKRYTSLRLRLQERKFEFDPDDPFAGWTD